MKSHNIHCVFHYLPLEKSEFYKNKHDGRISSNSQLFSDCLVRLPLFVDLTDQEQSFIVNRSLGFFKLNQ